MAQDIRELLRNMLFQHSQLHDLEQGHEQRFLERLEKAFPNTDMPSTSSDIKREHLNIDFLNILEDNSILPHQDEK